MGVRHEAVYFMESAEQASNFLYTIIKAIFYMDVSN